MMFQVIQGLCGCTGGYGSCSSGANGLINKTQSLGQRIEHFVGSHLGLYNFQKGLELKDRETTETNQNRPSPHTLESLQWKTKDCL